LREEEEGHEHGPEEAVGGVGVLGLDEGDQLAEDVGSKEEEDVAHRLQHKAGEELGREYFEDTEAQ